MRLLSLSCLMAFFFFACQSGTPKIEKEIIEIEEEIKVEVPEKITFPSGDGLTIHANLYHKSDSAPVMLLCHQARFNKFEYVKSALTFMEMGFNCLAIDQRSGGPIVEAFNETTLEAEKAGKSTEFLDAEQDIVAAINYAANKYKQPVILLGSSYSSSLALFIGATNENVKAVVSFSPGDYFKEDNPKYDLTKLLPSFSKPFWVPSSKEEEPELTKLMSLRKLSENQV